MIVNDLIVDKNNKLMKVDKIDLDYFDNSNVKNKFVLKRSKNNNYELKGSTLNADTIITNLLESKDDQQLDMFRESININLNFSEVDSAIHPIISEFGNAQG